MAFGLLHPALRAALAARGVREPTPIQAASLPRGLAGESLLLLAPTASGKTEAAMLPVLHHLAARDGPGIRALYVTPLRALNRDVAARLRAWAAPLGLRVDTRHADTPPEDRRRQAREPPDVLVTTPETLQAMLPSQGMGPHLRGVRHVVVDEAHALARDRRGAQLAAGLARLAERAGPFQRVALSATASDPAAIAALFGAERPLAVVQAGAPRPLEARVAWPAPDEGDVAASRDLRVAPPVAASLRALRDAVAGASGSLVFTNSRLSAELVASRLPRLGLPVAVHHGSLERAVREEAEAALREGRVPGLVCTPTLEHGLDVGPVERAVLYQSPRRAVALLQRAGRANHVPGRAAAAEIVAVGALDALEAAAVVRRARAGALEPLRPHVMALDVLGHQAAGVVLDRGGRAALAAVRALLALAQPFRGLGEPGGAAALDRVVGFLASLGLLAVEGADLVATPRTQRYYYTNLAMINDQRTYPVVEAAELRTIAALGEEEVLRYARRGHTFVVRGSAWRIVAMRPSGELLVEPSDDPAARVPDWEGEGANVPFAVAQEAAALRARIGAMLGAAEPREVAARLAVEGPLDAEAAARVVERIAEQLAAGAPVPGPGEVLVEAFDHYLLVHAPFGEVVNDALGDLLEELLAREGLVRFWWMDGYHVLLELTVPVEERDLPALVHRLFHHDEAAVEALLEAFLDDHYPLGTRMKGPAERLGAMPRGGFVSMEGFLALEARFRGTPVEEEGLREALLEHIDLDAVRALFADLREGRRRVVLHSAPAPTPFGRYILDRYVEEPERFGQGEGEAARAAERLRAFAATERVRLLCVACADLGPEGLAGKLPEAPACARCGARLLAPLAWHGGPVRDALRRCLAGGELGEDEAREVQRARQAAALVAVHGRRAVLALAVYGVGPQAAARVLAAMHRDEGSFWAALAEARQRFLATRGAWGRGQEGRRWEPAGKGYAYSPRASAFSDGRF